MNGYEAFALVLVGVLLFVAVSAISSRGDCSGHCYGEYEDPPFGETDYRIVTDHFSGAGPGMGGRARVRIEKLQFAHCQCEDCERKKSRWEKIGSYRWNTDFENDVSNG